MALSHAPRLDDLFAARARAALPPLFPPEDTNPALISLAYGLADPAHFPYAALVAATAETLAEEGGTALNYGEIAHTLVDQIVARLRAEGVEAEHEHILVGYGSSEILSLLPYVFLDPGDSVIVEGPTFLGAVRKLVRAGARIVSVPVDAQGMDVEALETILARLGREGVRPKFIYTIPTFQNPTGTTMPIERRQRLVELSAEYGVIVVEDDAYGELRFEGAPLPNLAALDAEGWVMRVSTYSKTLAPGIRLGWSYANPEITKRLAMFRTSGEGNPFVTRLVARYSANGRLEAHIGELVTLYRSKRDLMLEALAHELPEMQVLRPEGGFFVWGQLPEGISARKLLPLALAQGVEFLPGGECFADGQGDDAIRLAFSYQSAARIVEGITRLSRALRAYHPDKVTG